MPVDDESPEPVASAAPTSTGPLPDRPGQRRLPDRQPARLFAVAGGYVGAVLVVVVVVTVSADGLLGLVLSVAWAALLLVPLAVLAPVPRQRVAREQDSVPVLLRRAPAIGDGDGGTSPPEPPPAAAQGDARAQPRAS